MVIICRKLKRGKKLVTYESTVVLLQRSPCGFKRSKKKNVSLSLSAHKIEKKEREKRLNANRNFFFLSLSA